MQDTAIELATRNIHRVHDLIHAIFTHPTDSQAALDALLPMFTPGSAWSPRRAMSSRWAR